MSGAQERKTETRSSVFQSFRLGFTRDATVGLAPAALRPSLRSASPIVKLFLRMLRVSIFSLQRFSASALQRFAARRNGGTRACGAAFHPTHPSCARRSMHRLAARV